MQKEIIDYICDLHGYLIRLKEIHWSTDNNAEHLLCDEIMDDIRDNEDKFMESAMGLYDSRIKYTIDIFRFLYYLYYRKQK